MPTARNSARREPTLAWHDTNVGLILRCAPWRPHDPIAEALGASPGSHLSRNQPAPTGADGMPGIGTSRMWTIDVESNVVRKDVNGWG